MENFHGISIKSAKIRKTCGFCVTETHESAESTKQYEFPLRIGCICTQNHVFTGNQLFARKITFRGNVFPDAEMEFRERSNISPARVCGKNNLALLFKA